MQRTRSIPIGHENRRLREFADPWPLVRTHDGFGRGPLGFVDIDVVHVPTNTVIGQMPGSNVILTQGRETLPNLLFGADAAADQLILTHMAWGDGGHDVATGDAVPAQATDTGLSNEILRKTITVDYPVTTTGRGSAAIESDELVDQAISEVVLLNAAGQAFCRRTHAKFTKSVDFRLVYRYSILF